MGKCKKILFSLLFVYLTRTGLYWKSSGHFMTRKTNDCQFMKRKCFCCLILIWYFQVVFPSRERGVHPLSQQCAGSRPHMLRAQHWLLCHMQQRMCPSSLPLLISTFAPLCVSGLQHRSMTLCLSCPVSPNRFSSILLYFILRLSLVSWFKCVCCYWYVREWKLSVIPMARWVLRPAIRSTSVV